MTDWKAVSRTQVPRVCAVCRYVVDCERHQACAGCGVRRACDDKGWRVCGEGVLGCGPFCPACAAAGRVQHVHG